MTIILNDFESTSTGPVSDARTSSDLIAHSKLGLKRITNKSLSVAWRSEWEKCRCHFGHGASEIEIQRKPDQGRESNIRDPVPSICPPSFSRLHPSCLLMFPKINQRCQALPFVLRKKLTEPLSHPLLLLWRLPEHWSRPRWQMTLAVSESAARARKRELTRSSWSFQGSKTSSQRW